MRHFVVASLALSAVALARVEVASETAAPSSEFAAFGDAAKAFSNFAQQPESTEFTKPSEDVKKSTKPDIALEDMFAKLLGGLDMPAMNNNDQFVHDFLDSFQVDPKRIEALGNHEVAEIVELLRNQASGEDIDFPAEAMKLLNKEENSAMKKALFENLQQHKDVLDQYKTEDTKRWTSGLFGGGDGQEFDFDQFLQSFGSLFAEPKSPKPEL